MRLQDPWVRKDHLSLLQLLSAVCVAVQAQAVSPTPPPQLGVHVTSRWGPRSSPLPVRSALRFRAAAYAVC